MGVSLAGSNPARSVILYYKQLTLCIDLVKDRSNVRARLAQSVEHQTFNLRVKGSSPLLGANFFHVFGRFVLVSVTKLNPVICRFF